jgi:hypothetical protein
MYFISRIIMNISVRTKSSLKLSWGGGGGGMGEFNNSPPSGAEDKNEWSDAFPPPHMPSWRGDGHLYLYHYLQNHYKQ